MVIIIIASIIVLLWLYMQWYSREQDRELHRLRMLQERNKQVLLFRWHVLHTWGVDAFEQLPHCHVMLNSDKPLVVKEWVGVDKLVNLN